MQPTQPPSAPRSSPKIGDLVHRISDDVKVLASGQAELAGVEIVRGVRSAAMEGLGVVLGGIVVLIGLCLLCGAPVVALEPAISPLWLRMLIMAVAYLAIGSVIAGVLAKRLKRDATPDLSRTTEEAKETAREINQSLAPNQSLVPNEAT